MTYALDIDIHEPIDDAIDGILGELEVAIENIRKSRAGPSVHREEVDVHDLLAGHQAIGLIWDADMLMSTYPHLSRDDAWEVLQECDRNYTAEHGLTWDDVGEVVEELHPEPLVRRWHGRLDVTITDTDGHGMEAALNRMKDMAVLLTRDTPEVTAIADADAIHATDE